MKCVDESGGGNDEDVDLKGIGNERDEELAEKGMALNLKV